MNYIIYDKAGKILRTIHCSPAMSEMQAKEGEFMLEGTANDATQKVVGGRVVDKTPEEIAGDNPPEPKQPQKQPANITNEQWQDVLKRLSKLETRT